MANYNQIINLPSRIEQFRSNLSGDNLIGVFIIKLKDWNIKSFLPVVFLTQDRLILEIDGKYSSINLTDSKISIQDNIRIEENEVLEFSLVNIDSELTEVNSEYTKKFYKLISNLKSTRTIDHEALSELPNQIFVGRTTKIHLKIIVLGLGFLTFGIFLQGINLNLAFFLLTFGFSCLLAGSVSYLRNK